ncbi:hypothetical protein V8F20_001279 [Naviculisporaceae sp. PSN 640]
MSFTSNDALPWTTGGGSPVASTSEYDLIYFPVTTAAFGATGTDLSSSTHFFDRMHTSTRTLDDSTYNPYYQCHVDWVFSEQDGEVSQIIHQEANNQDAKGQGSNKEDTTKRKGKKRPPRKYTAEQLAKRREQNRKAQRTYRDRKDQRIKELEEQLAAASQQTEIISSAIDALSAEHAALTGPSVTGYPSSYGVYPSVTGA